MPASILKIAIAAACVGSLLGTGVVIGQEGQSDSTFSVGPRQLLQAGEPSPTDFPGIRGDARGRPIARGATVIGYAVTITRGETLSYPTFTIRCPRGKVLKTFAQTGGISPAIVGRSPFVRRRAFEYRNKPDWGVVVDFNAREVTRGETTTGTVYGYCR